jgi:hypothetical protein
MKYTIFNPTTGEIISTVSSTSVEAVEAHLSDKSYIDDHYSSLTHYIDLETQTPVAKPQDPSTDREIYRWDHASKTWVLDVDLITVNARIQRNNLLLEIDAVSPVRYASLTAEQQVQLQTYRQLLLDVPQQSNFPTAIDWPTKPTWL